MLVVLGCVVLPSSFLFVSQRVFIKKGRENKGDPNVPTLNMSGLPARMPDQDRCKSDPVELVWLITSSWPRQLTNVDADDVNAD